MKYLKFSLIIIVLLAINIWPLLALGAAGDSLMPCTGEESSEASGAEGQTPCTFTHFFVLIQTVVNYLVKIAAIIATIAIVIAGIWLATSGGNESHRSKAQEIIQAALIGLIIVLAAWLIVTAIVFALTDQDGTIGSRFRELFPQ